MDIFSIGCPILNEDKVRKVRVAGTTDTSLLNRASQGMILYPHYPAASEEGRGDLRKRSHEQQRQQVLQAVYDFAWNSEGGDGKYRHVKLSQKCG